jgi:hypothetical protein
MKRKTDDETETMKRGRSFLVFAAAMILLFSAGPACLFGTPRIETGLGFFGSVFSDYTETRSVDDDPSIWGRINSLQPYLRADMGFLDRFLVSIAYRQGFILPQDMYFYSDSSWTEIGGHTEQVTLYALYRLYSAPGAFIDIGLGGSFMHVMKTFTDFYEDDEKTFTGNYGYYRMLYPSPGAMIRTDLSLLPVITFGGLLIGSPWGITVNQIENPAGPSMEIKEGFNVLAEVYIGLEVTTVMTIRVGYRHEYHYFNAPGPYQLDLELNLRGPFAELVFSF